jgi:hypothetical protein
LEGSCIDVQDGDNGCLLFFTSESGSTSTGLGQAGNSGSGLPGVLLLNSSAMIAGVAAFGSYGSLWSISQDGW